MSLDEPQRTALEDVAEFLNDCGHKVARVWKLWSAGESDFGVETALYTTPDNKTMTACWFKDAEPFCFAGWGYQPEFA